MNQARRTDDDDDKTPASAVSTMRSLRSKLTLVFLLLGLGAVGSGAVGLHFVARVASSVSIFTEQTVPITNEAMALLDTARQLKSTAVDAVRDGHDGAGSMKTILDLHATTLERIERLKHLVQNADVGLSLNAAEAGAAAYELALREVVEAWRYEVRIDERLERLRGNIDQNFADAFKLASRIKVASETALVEAQAEMEAAMIDRDGLAQGSMTMARAFFRRARARLNATTTLRRQLSVAQDAISFRGNTTQALNKRAEQARRAMRLVKLSAKNLRTLLITEEARDTLQSLEREIEALDTLALGTFGIFNVSHTQLEADRAFQAGFDRLDEVERQYYGQLQQLQDVARAMNEEAQAEVHSVISQLLALAGVILLAYIAFAFIIGYIVSHRITEPISLLTAHAIRISCGGALKRIDDCKVILRTDEIGELARAFNSMLAELAFARRQLVEQSERDVEVQFERLNAAVNTIPHGLIMIDEKRDIVIGNSRFAEIYGIDPATLIPGVNFKELLRQSTESGIIADDEGTQRGVLRGLATRRQTYFTLTLQDGRSISISHNPTADGGSVSVHEDVTERLQHQKRIAHMAMHDMLTELPNRVAFREHLVTALSRVARGDRLALLCFDLDHFKAVNDTLGHPVGDKLLKMVAERARACLRESDLLARLGGDEFAIVQLGANAPELAAALASRLICDLSRPYEINGHKVVIGSSVGIALAPQNGHNPDDLLRNADMALYRSKELGRGVHSFFEPEMNARMQARRALELELRQALVAGDFELYFQPAVKSETGQIGSFETLLRWNHPERGLLPPGDFIHVLEEIGLIVKVGRWIFREACTAATTWPSHLNISVNVSKGQFKSGRLIEDIADALRESGLDPGRLEVEITESILLDEPTGMLSTLRRLRELGVKVVMDDFGTGRSSLGYLRMFTFDKIKIDRTFVQDLTSIESIAVMRAVSELAQTLGIATVAEGIETEEQLVRAQTEGCEELQGYLFSRPVSLDKVSGLIARARPGVRRAVA